MPKAVQTMVHGFNTDRSVVFYREVFGLTKADHFDSDDFDLVYLGDTGSDFKAELTPNEDQTEPCELGYGDLAVCVDDLEAENQRSGEVGFESRRLVALEKDGGVAGEFPFVAGPDEDQIEVLQLGGRGL